MNLFSTPMSNSALILFSRTSWVTNFSSRRISRFSIPSSSWLENFYSYIVMSGKSSLISVLLTLLESSPYRSPLSTFSSIISLWISSLALISVRLSWIYFIARLSMLIMPGAPFAWLDYWFPVIWPAVPWEAWEWSNICFPVLSKRWLSFRLPSYFG